MGVIDKETGKQACANCHNETMAIVYRNTEWPYGRCDIVCERCGNTVIRGVEP